MDAAPRLIVMPLLVALVSPLEAAVNVYVPGVFTIRLEKVAIPPTAATVVVPVTPEAVEVIVTEAPDVVTRFPLVSSTLTVAPKGAPSVALAGGSVVKTSLDAVPAPITILELVALVSPPDAAVSV